MQGVMDTAFAPECPLWGHPDRKEMYIASAVANQMTEHCIKKLFNGKTAPNAKDAMMPVARQSVQANAKAKRAFKEILKRQRSQSPANVKAPKGSGGWVQNFVRWPDNSGSCEPACYMCNAM